jgi:hypothetical protein
MEPIVKLTADRQGWVQLKWQYRKYWESKEAGINPRYIFQPYVGLSFDSEEEAVEFYNMHSWEVGFGTKRQLSSTIC